jgi:D-psicose/D-tagatose/L-ribulose 3-epimerase
MKIAISNIAWAHDADATVAAMMADRGIKGLEIAPTVVWPDPAKVSRSEALAYRRWWEDRGIEIVAMQSLLYGRPELVIFGTESDRLATLDHLAVIFRLASWLGATRLVFGSPSNRRAGDLATPERVRIATEFFRRAGDAAAQAGTTLCLEPNPPQYGCDFINSAREARELITRVGCDGFGLHLDAGAMALQGEEAAEATDGGLPLHFHVSEPFLAPLGSAETDHSAFASALRRARYAGWCSIEARKPENAHGVEAIGANLAFAAETYG